MKRYVDVDKILEIASGHKDFTQSIADLTSLREVLEDTPTADVAEVVHCKDCKHFLDKQRKNHQGICMCGEKDTSYASDFYPYADDFCSYGERKDEE